MENKELHHKKVAILSRLVKESSLTLEEALLLLKTEDVHESVQQPAWNHGTTTPWTEPYKYGSPAGISNWPLTGTISVPNNDIIMNTTGVSTTTTTLNIANATYTADL